MNHEKRNHLAVLAALAGIPIAACTDKGGTASDPYGNLTSATTTSPGETGGDSDSGMSESATGEVGPSEGVTDPATTAPETTGVASSSDTSSTSDAMTTDVSTSSDATAGEPSPLCTDYAAKMVECARNPRYDEEHYTSLCMTALLFAGSMECRMAQEEWFACIGAADCMGLPEECQGESGGIKVYC